MALGGRVGRKIAHAAGLGPVMLAAQGMEQLVAQMKAFVAALSPSTIQIFTQEMNNLNATIGQAFLPAVQVMIGAIREMANTLSPFMKQLAPIFQQMAQTLTAQLIPTIKFVVGVFQELLPLIQLLADMQESLELTTTALRLLGAIITPIILQFKLMALLLLPLMGPLKLLTTVLDGIALQIDAMSRVLDAAMDTVIAFADAFLPVLALGDIIDQVTQAFRDVAKSMILFIAYVAKALGQQQFLNNLIARFTPKEEGQRVVAQGPVAIKDLQAISKDLAMASAAAQGDAGKAKAKDQNEWLADIAGALIEVRDGAGTLETFLEEQITRVVDAILKRFPSPPESLKEAASAAGKGDVRGFARTTLFGQAYNKFKPDALPGL